MSNLRAKPQRRMIDDYIVEIQDYELQPIIDLKHPKKACEDLYAFFMEAAHGCQNPDSLVLTTHCCEGDVFSIDIIERRLQTDEEFEYELKEWEKVTSMIEENRKKQQLEEYQQYLLLKKKYEEDMKNLSLDI
jgi:hypothetical protein